jgi:hypothetical protein
MLYPTCLPLMIILTYSFSSHPWSCSAARRLQSARSCFRSVAPSRPSPHPGRSCTAAAWPRTHPVAPAVQCPWPVRRATIASLQLRTMSQAGRRPRGLRREPTPYDRADCHRPCQCPAAARAAASLGGRAAADALQLRVLAPYSSAAAACRWILIRGTACVRTHPHLRAKKTDHMRTK